LEQIEKIFYSFIPVLIVIVIFIFIGVFFRFVFNKIKKGSKDLELTGQLSRIIYWFFAFLAIVSFIPIGDVSKGHLFSFFGILLSATIALSSTTFLGNAMAGLMLKALKNFKLGDFIILDGFRGRVTEQGLFHTEIQTEFSQLVTIPNLQLVTKAITVIRSNEVMITATVSLGYDVNRMTVENALVEAAKKTGLESPFVKIENLGDYSVTYRISGFSDDIKKYILHTAHLKGNIVDELHICRIEIVSPSFMNQRVYETEKKFIPKQINKRGKSNNEKDDSLENIDKIIFSKAEEIEHINDEMEKIGLKIEKLELKLKSVEKDKAISIEKQIIELKSSKSKLETLLTEKQSE